MIKSIKGVSLKNEFSSGLVVFLVAIPLCLGISLASGAPLMAGIITGIVGGLVVSLLSGSSLSVSGPAAGLTVLVLSSIEYLGSYGSFLLAVVVAGILQLVLGYLKAGKIVNFFPSSVIKGMLAAIGLILVLKQIPHGLGVNNDFEGDLAFQQMDNQNTFSEIFYSVLNIHPSAFFITLLSLFLLYVWDKKFAPVIRFLKGVPGPLIVVLFGIGMNMGIESLFPAHALSGSHLVSIPEFSLSEGLGSIISFPDFGQLLNWKIFVVAGTLALVASLETLLCLDATDKLDPLKRTSSPDKELKAQGVGNILAGLIGGIPMTAVIVRSSANINAGAKTRLSAFFHGLLILISVMLVPHLLNLIPLASLAAILIMIGYKLAKWSLFKEMYDKGQDQFYPFMITILAILFTDLLTGIAIGMGVGLLWVLWKNQRKKLFLLQEIEPLKQFKLVLKENISFLHKPQIMATLNQLPENSSLYVDLTYSEHIDQDILETLQNFREKASSKNIQVEIARNNKCLT